MNRIKLIIGMAIFSFVSCTNQLELSPVSSISTVSFWKTEDDAKGAVNGMYARLRSVTASNLYIWGESRSQNLRQSVGNDFANLRNYDNTLDATSAGPDWSTVYRVVNDANYIIQYVPTIEDISTEDARNQLLAEAYAMRAFCYFVMVKTWGEVPLVIEPTEGYDPEVIYKERASVTQVFDLIKADIDQALSLFPDNNFLPGRNRWSKPGANALKADVYLWTGKVLQGGQSDFQAVLSAIAEIESSDVELLEDFERVFDYDNKGNQEVIMANNFSLYETSGTFMDRMYVDGYPPNSNPANIEVIGAIGGGNYWTLTDETLSKFHEDDQRTEKTFTKLYYSEDPDSDVYEVFYGCIQRKFNGVVESGSRQFLDDVVLYRYADVILMKAEAQNALGQDPSEAMNMIRKRAFGDQYPDHVFESGTQDENDLAILEERLVEMLYEGKYWWDILRFGKATELIPYFAENPGDTYKYVWPISLDILSKEPKVVQNTGY